MGIFIVNRKYITGNSWGVSSGISCVGCKDKNEEFYSCSDIAIHNEIEIIIDPVGTTTKATEIRRKWELAVIFSRSFDLTTLMGQYWQKMCSNNCAVAKEKTNLILYNNCIQSCNELRTVKLPLDRHCREYFKSLT